MLANDPGKLNLATVAEYPTVGEGNRLKHGARPQSKTAGREAERASGPDGAAKCARVATYCLTMGHFNKATGKAQRLADAESWNRELAGEHARLSTVSRNTSYPGRLGEYHAVVSAVAEAVHASRAKRRVRRAKFTYYMRSTSVIDKFWAMVRRGRARDGTLGMEDFSLLAYGEAGVSGRWAGGGPHRRMWVSAQRTFRKSHVVRVDEYNTSKKHAYCGAVLAGVVSRGGHTRHGGVYGAVERGIKMCTSTSCLNFVDRDVNAALNILHAFIATLRVSKGRVPLSAGGGGQHITAAPQLTTHPLPQPQPHKPTLTLFFCIAQGQERPMFLQRDGVTGFSETGAQIAARAAKAMYYIKCEYFEWYFVYIVGENLSLYNHSPTHTQITPFSLSFTVKIPAAKQLIFRV